MSKPFIIWTMRRTGGTALTDLLMEMSEYETIDHEPFQMHRKFGYIATAFSESRNNNEDTDIPSLLENAFREKPLIKHCYEIADPNFNETLVDFLKNSEYKHIFLIRRDEVSRVLSLFLAYMSDVWGKHGSEGMYEMIRNGEKILPAFDLDAMRKEEEYSTRQTAHIREVLRKESIEFQDVYFEDLYSGSKESREANLYALLDYLEFDEERIDQYSEMIGHILFNRDQKSKSILEFVPNYMEAKQILEEMVGEYSTEANREEGFSSLDLVLYLGAHKTATTHLQGILRENRAVLESQNIKLSSPSDVRKEWLPVFFKFCNKNDQTALEQVRALAPQKGKWILTEENIAGVSNDFAVLPGMYPKVGERLACLSRVFTGADISLFFSLRSYDSFYRSAYSEVVRNRGYIPFFEFYDEERFRENSWLEMVRQFANVIPEEKIILWRFEDFRSLAPTLIEKLTGIEEVQPLIDSYEAERTRPSLSQKTMDILSDLYPVLDRKESLKLVERINRAYPVSEGYAPLSTFDEVQTKRFKQAYERDVEMIKKEFPGIQFLTPEGVS